MGVIQYVNRPGPIPLEPVVDMLKNEAAGFAVDFVTGKAFIRGGGKDMLPRDINGFLTYASPSAKNIFNAAGQMVSGTALRSDHDASGPLGLYVEGQQTNLLAWSQDFTKWLRYGVEGDFGYNYAVAPDGTQTMLRIKPEFMTDPGSSARSIGIYSSAGSSVVGDVLTMSIFIKPINVTSRYPIVTPDGVPVQDRDLYLVLQSDTSNGGGAVNLRTMQTEGPLAANTVVKEIGGGVYRVWMTYTVATTDASNIHFFRLANRWQGSFDPYPSGEEEVLLWGAQVVKSNSPGSYIRTEGSQVTRAADNITLPLSAFPYSTEAGTFLVEFEVPNYTANLGRTGGIIGVGAGNSRIRIDTSTGTGRPISTQHYNGGPSRNARPQVSFDDLTVNTTHKVALALTTLEAATALDGQLGVKDVAGGFISLEMATKVLKIGNRADLAQQLDGHIKSFVYIPRHLTDAELIARTTL